MILLCACLSVALLHAETEQKERLLHVPGSVLLLGYPDDDTLFVARDREELTLQPPGTNRGGHHTYPSLSARWHHRGDLVREEPVPTLSGRDCHVLAG